MKPVILWNNIFTASQIAVTSEASGFPKENLVGLRPYKRWRGTSSIDHGISITLASSKAADSVGLVGHNLGSIGATVAIQGWISGAFQTLATAQPTTNKAMVILFNSQTLQNWRLYLTTLSGAPEIGSMILGPRLTMEKYLQSGFDPDAQTTYAESSVSQSANLLGTVVRYRERNVQARFQSLTPAWVDANLKSAWEGALGIGQPFFWAWEMDLHPTEVYFMSCRPPVSLGLPYDPVRRSFSLDMKGPVE